MSSTIVPDGQASFEGGQDSSLPPSRLAENRFAAGVNISTSKGVISSRYGYERKTLKFPEGGYSYKFNKIADFKTIFEGGKFQGYCEYSIGNRDYFLIIISGVIFLIDIVTYKVRVLTVDKDTQVSETLPRSNWSFAGRFIILFDFPSRPVIIDGFIARRSSAANLEIPAAKLGVFNQGRLDFANEGNEWSAGDVVGNELTPDAPVTANEILLNGSPYYADIYRIDSINNNPITGMATLQGADTSTGYGQLIVGSRNQLFAYNTIDGRELWKAGKFGKSISDKAGFAGPRAMTNVGQDLFFESEDGQLRSLSTSRDEQKKYARVPMSKEVSNWIGKVNPDLTQFAVMTSFKNKLFWAVRPYRIPALRLNGSRILDVAHAGMLVLDLDNVSRLGVDSPPAWDGLWTGLRPLDMAVVNERMFVMSKDYYSRNSLYEVDPDLNYDRTYEGRKRPIQSHLYTREHNFQDAFGLKSLTAVELDITDVEGEFSLDIDWKPAHGSKFFFWKRFACNVPTSYQELDGNGDIPERTPLSFRELRFGLPDNGEANPITKELYDVFKKVQLRFIIKGDNWSFNNYKVEAKKDEENKTQYTEDINEAVQTEIKDNFSDWTYEEFGL